MASSSAGGLAADMEALQLRTTAALQQIDANFSRANELAAEMFPLVRGLVKQLVVADDASKTWHDTFLDAAGALERPGVEEGDGEGKGQEAPFPRTPAAKTPLRVGADSDATPDLDESDLSSVRPGTASRGPRRDGLTLFSPPVSTPFLRAARTPGRVSGFHHGGLVGLSSSSSPASPERPAASGELSAADLEAPSSPDSPDMASPEMPALSSRAAVLLQNLGGLSPAPGAPSSAAAGAASAAAGNALGRSRAKTPGRTASGRPMTMADVPADGLDDSAAWDVGGSSEEEGNDDGNLLAHLGASSAGLALSRHSLALVAHTPAAAVGPGSSSARETGGGASADGAAALAQLTAEALASAKKPSAPDPRRSAAAAAAAAAASGSASSSSAAADSDDDMEEPAPLELTTVGQLEAAPAEPRLLHSSEFSLSAFPPLFRSGKPAAELIAVWTAVSAGQDEAEPRALSARQVAASLVAHDGDAAPGEAAVRATLGMLQSRGLLCSFQDGGETFWRLHAFE